MPTALQASAPELPRCFAVPGRLGVLSTRHALGRIEYRSPNELCAAVVRKSAGAIAKLHEGARTFGVKSICLAVERTTRSPSHTGAFERRSGGALAAADIMAVQGKDRRR